MSEEEMQLLWIIADREVELPIHAIGTVPGCPLCERHACDVCDAHATQHVGVHRLSVLVCDAHVGEPAREYIWRISRPMARQLAASPFFPMPTSWKGWGKGA